MFLKLSEIDSNNLNNRLIKQIFFNIKKENYNYADYIIIYGCHIKQWLDERLYYALKVLNSHDFGKVILTGGIGVNGNFNESEYMKEYLISNGIDESKIIVENKSTTTEENNFNTINMLGLKKVDCFTNIVLITHEFHLLRIILYLSKSLNNDNIHFYYDYVDNSDLSYDKMVNNLELIELLKNQIEVTKQFIKDGQYIDMEI